MTSRERLLAAMSRQTPDRVPRDLPGFTPISWETYVRNAGGQDPMEYFKIDHRGLAFAPSVQKTDYTPYFQGRGYDLGRMRIDEFGVGYLRSEHTSWHYEHFLSPLKESSNLNDFADFPLPDDDAAYRSDHWAAVSAALHARGLAVSGPLAMTLFEKAWQIRGLEEFLADMTEDPDIVCCLLDRLLAMRLKTAEAYARADVDVLMLGDDVAMQTGMMMSPAHWREFLKPRMAAIIDAARRIKPGLHIFYHSDGKPERIFDELIDIGVTVLDPIQPECVDPAEVKRRYGHRAAFWGAIGIQHTLPFGSPEDVRDEVRLRMRTIGKGGGYVIGPTHVIAPEVPWENLKALYDAADEFGSYGIN
jgi:uroporphyrinogen decarboxylase